MLPFPENASRAVDLPQPHSVSITYSYTKEKVDRAEHCDFGLERGRYSTDAKVCLGRRRGGDIAI